MHDRLPPGVTLISADNFEEWFLDIQVLDDNPLYRNEVYRLKFRFSGSYPIGIPSSLLPYRLWTRSDIPPTHRSTRSRIRQRLYAPDTHTPTHLLEWHNLPRHPRQARMEPGAQRREHLCQPAEHAHRQHEERATAGRRGFCEEQYPEAEGHQLVLS